MNFKIKSLVLLLLAIAFVCGNMLIVYNFKRKNKQIVDYKKDIYSLKLESEFILDHFVEREKRYYESVNWSINQETMLFNINGDSCRIRSNFDLCPILVFRFSDQNCATCIDVELKRLKEKFQMHKHRVIFIVSNKSIRDLQLLKRYNSIEYEIYTIKENSLSIPLDKYNIPYLFILDCYGTINSVFIPIQENEELSQQFYDYCDKYFNSLNL